MTTKNFHRSTAVMATVFAILILLTAILPLTACGKAAVEITKLNKETLSLTVGSSSSLSCTYSRELDEGETVTVEWASDKTSVATVDAKGSVKGISAGTATITATLGNSSATCAVTVSDKYEVTLDVSSLILDVDGDSAATITATVKKNGAAVEDKVEWQSSDETIATVANGVVTALKVGNASITATSNGVKATCSVTVKSSNAPYTVTVGSSNANVAKDPGVWYYFGKTSDGVAAFEGANIERTVSENRENITAHFDSITILEGKSLDKMQLYLRYMTKFEEKSQYIVSFTFESNTAGRVEIGTAVKQQIEPGKPVEITATETVNASIPLNIKLFFEGENIDFKLTGITFMQA